LPKHLWQCKATQEDPETLLKNARARLLHDLSEGTERDGDLTLPQTLAKYKEVRDIP